MNSEQEAEQVCFSPIENIAFDALKRLHAPTMSLDFHSGSSQKLIPLKLDQFIVVLLVTIQVIQRIKHYFEFRFSLAFLKFWFIFKLVQKIAIDILCV